MGRKLFCEINDTCYNISLFKERMIRKQKDLFCRDKFAKDKSEDKLKYLIKGHRSLIVRKLNGVDIKLQENKATNLKIAGDKITNVIIHPGETFSFWKLVGYPTKKKGYKEGLIISKKGFYAGIGGGLCQLANMVHYLILNSPLEVVELHHHSDALFPDERRRVPFGTGTSVLYNNIDYRFKNTLNCDVQLIIWQDENDLLGELRCEKENPYRYKLVEEDHHFKKEKDIYYRNSKVYRITIDKKTKKEVNKELILNNHSKVMYDYNLIPKEQIRK